MSFLTFQKKQISGIPAGKACDLAIRNAWFAGCVEWDCGRCGLDVNHCSPRFACRLDDTK